MNIKTLLTDELFMPTTEAELGQYCSREEVIAGRAIAKTKQVIFGELTVTGGYVSGKTKYIRLEMPLLKYQEFKKLGE